MAYEQHPEFDLPPDETKIWRYLDFTKLVSMLHSHSLYFASVKTIAAFDAFEGLYTRANLSTLRRLYLVSRTLSDALKNAESNTELPEPIRAMLGNETTSRNAVHLARLPELVKSWRAIIFINCWHIAEHESAAMWKTYLKSNEGVAIQSTIGRLKDSIKAYGEFSIHIGKVNYVDFDTFEIPAANLLSPFLHKRKSFEYEHELRALIFGAQHSKMDLNKPEDAPKGLEVSTDLDVLVDKVYASPTAETWLVELLKSTCLHYGLTKDVVQSDLANPSLY
jgi:hypothetical protein